MPNTKMPYIDRYNSLEELSKETEGFWDNPQNILNLIDLLFLFDDGEQIPS